MFPLHSVLRGPKARARAGVSLRAHRHTSQHSLRLRVEALEDRRLLSVAPSLLADLAVDGPDAWVLGEANGVTYLSIDDEVLGTELWKIDGATDEIVLVKDINPGSGDSDPFVPVAAGGTTFFTANDGTHGKELWKTDGTEEGTVLVKDFLPGAQQFGPSIRNVNDTLFVFTSPAGQKQLWTSDGSEEGTVLVKEFGDLRLGSSVEFNGMLVFRTEGGINGPALWKSDGTTEGTLRVKNVARGDSYIVPAFLTNVGGTLFFSGNDGTNGGELWKSDGTETGTVMVKDIAPGAAGADIRQLVNVDGRLLFFANDGTHGSELWTSDGTAAGTMLVKDVHPGSGGSLAPNPWSISTNVEGTLFFWGNDGTNGYAMWKSDGTEQGTVMVKDIFQGAEQYVVGFDPIVSFNGEAFFTANDGIHGNELWKSDGTPQGTVMVKDVAPGMSSGASGPTNFGGTLYFFGNDLVHGSQYWKSDGTAEGTVRLLNAEPDISEPSRPHSFTAAGNVTYFVSGGGLWRTDGTREGTFLVSAPGRGTVENLTHVNGVLYATAAIPSIFDGTYPPSTFALFKSDGTTEGTVRVGEPFPNNERPKNAINANGTLFFQTRDDDSRDDKIWRSDGTAEGTVSLAEGTDPTNVNGTVFFFGKDPEDYGLMKTDGTPEGTVLVRDRMGATQLTNVDGTLFFFGSSGRYGTELWKSDGTREGTVMVKDVRPGPLGSNRSSNKESAAAGGLFYFRANDGTHGYELWQSDGTEAGTVMVKDIWPGGDGSFPSLLQDFGGSLLFQADDGQHGREWWTTDGTQAGTMLLGDINPGPADSTPNRFPRGSSTTAGVGGTAYFAANDGSGDSLWMSDGTTAGTVQVTAAGVALSGARHLANINGILYLSADDGVHGDEPWLIAPDVVAGLFYNNAGGDDDALEGGVPLAHDKLPYYAGDGTAAFDNISNYVHGINGINVDLPAEHGPLTADDFTFKIGSGNDPQTWALGPPPAGISVLPGAGVAGKDRVQIVWPDGAIKNTWLQVMVKGNDAAGGFHTNTGLEASTIFYFGSRVGDAGGGSSPVAFLTTAADQIEVRRHAGPTTPSTARYDFDQNGLLDAADELIARGNIGFLRKLDIATSTPEVVFPRDDDARAAIAAALAAPQTSDAPDVQTAAALVAHPRRAAMARPAHESPPTALLEAALAPAHSIAGDPASIDLALDEELLDSLPFEPALA